MVDQRNPATQAEPEMTAHYACSTCGATSGFQLLMTLGMDYNDINKSAVFRDYPMIRNWSPKDGDVRQYEVVDILEGDYDCAQAVFDPRKPRGKKAASLAPETDGPSRTLADYWPAWWCPSCGEVTSDLDDLVEKVG